MTTTAAEQFDPSTQTTRVSPKTVDDAISSLLKWKTEKSKTEKPQLLEQDEFVYLTVTLKKIPQTSRTNAHRIRLPHPLINTEEESPELCLIIDDRPKSGLSKEDAVKKIESENIPITKVLKLSKLKTDYKAFEAKRKLFDSYDMFFADRRVIPMLPRLIGKKFFVQKKIPLPVDLKHKNWKQQIEKGCGSAMFFVSTGTCSVVKVGKLSMDSDEVVENVMATLNGVVEVLPSQWKYVRSLHLKLSESVSLPIYQCVPDLKLKIDDFEEESGVTEEEKKKKGKSDGVKGKKKKGRIHEVRCMDSNVSEVLDEDEVSIESGGVKEKNKRKKEGSVVDDDAEKPKKKVAKSKLKEKRNSGLKPEKKTICDLNSQDKDPVKSIHFSNSNPMCHAFDPDAKDGHDLLIGLNSGDVYTVSLRQQLQDVSKKLVGALHYNKDGSANNSRCTSIAWVPGGDGAFVVAHADGNLYVYEKNKDSATDSTFPAIKDPTQFSVDKAKNSKSIPVARWHICQGSINSIAFSNDGSHLATVGRDGYLRIFDFSTQKLVCGGKSYYGALLCCSWSMDGKYILTGGEDDLVQVWSMDDRKVVAWGEGHNSWVSGVAFDSYWSSPNTDGSGEHIMYRFGSVGQDTQILLWDLEMDEIVVPLRRPPGGSPTYSTGSQSAHWDNVIPVGTLQPAPCKRDVPKLSPVIAHRVHTEPLSGLMFTQESVVTACREGHLKIWTRPSASETQANSSEANPAIALLSTSFPKDNKGSLSSKIGGSSLKS